MRTLFNCGVLLAFSTNGIRGEDTPSEPEIQCDRLMTYYYLRKNTNSIPKLLKLLQETKMLDAHPSATVSTAAFLSVIFSENPAKAVSFAKCESFTGNTKKAVQIALWRSGHSKDIGKVFGKTPSFAKKKAVSLKDIPMKGADELDMMWGAFLASGDVDYVKRVIDTLDEKKTLSGDDLGDAATRGAAEWSLASNMLQHELVYRLIRDEAKSRKGAVQKKLTKILETLKKVSLPEKDGDFSAMLVVMDESDLEEFKKSQHEPVHLKQKSVAKRGDIVGIKIMFTGIELTEDLRALVSYDLKVLDPDGKVYDETDLKRLEGLHGQVPTRFTFFDNPTIVMIRFEDKDKLGKYKFIAKVYDQIGHKSIALEQEVELKE